MPDRNIGSFYFNVTGNSKESAVELLAIIKHGDENNPHDTVTHHNCVYLNDKGLWDDMVDSSIWELPIDKERFQTIKGFGMNFYV